MREGKERVHLNLARIKKHGETFEIDVDPDIAMKFKKGIDGVTIHDVLKAENIFSDAQKGLVVSETKLKELFGTNDVLEIAKTIVKEGEIQLTPEYRAQVRAAKVRRIVSIIHQNGIDPRSKAPHPAARIEAAMEEAKVRIDEHKKAEDQVQDIIDALRVVLPISISKKEIWIHIPPEHAAKIQGTIRSMSKIIDETWNNDGSWDVTVEIPGGLQEEFFDKLNNLTRGVIETKIIKE